MGERLNSLDTVKAVWSPGKCSEWKPESAAMTKVAQIWQCRFKRLLAL